MANLSEAQLPGRLTDDNVCDPNFFRDDIKQMYDQVEEIGEFADKLKNDIDTNLWNPENKEMLRRGSMVFAAEELKAITSLYSTKGSITNQIIGAKAKLAQLSGQKKKDAVNNAESAYLTRQFQDMFMKHKEVVSSSPVSCNPRDRAFLEDRIAEMESDGTITYSDTEQVMKYEKRGVEFKISETQNGLRFVPVTQDTGEPLLDYPVSLYPDSSVLENAIRNGDHYESQGTVYRIY
jgi:hypothetical protein